MLLNWRRLVLLLLAIILIASAWLGIVTAREGLKITWLQKDNLPLLYVAPQDVKPKPAPGVLVAHGFAGSKQLMLGYGHVLAHAGYAVMLWDFDGHGANPKHLSGYQLQQNLNTALEALLEKPEVDPTRLAVLGHSMGSGIAMTAGISDVNRFAATIAVSPTGATVTPKAPRNLQLQVGSAEGWFIDNAQRLLAEAGGKNSNLAQGQGRELIIVPNVEHITILFSDGSHQSALRWLNNTFGIERKSDYVDRRIIWYGVHLLGWLVGLAAIAPLIVSPSEITNKTSPLRQCGGLIAAPLSATAGLILLNHWISLSDFGGIQVGGAVGIWFCIAGLTWLGILAQLPRPDLKSMSLGIVVFSLLWIGFGLMAQEVWLQWWLIPSRLSLWLPLALASLPWFLATGIVQQQIGIGRRVLWWLGQSIVTIAGFILTLSFLPQLSFVFLLLPLFPVLFGILSLVAGLVEQPWVYAIASTLLFGWILAAGFPLS